MSTSLDALWREITTPSRADEPLYTWWLIAIGHGFAGLLIASLSIEWLASARVAVPMLYWIVKERADLSKGGSVADSIVDTGFVAVGMIAWPYGPPAVAATATIGAAIRGYIAR